MIWGHSNVMHKFLSLFRVMLDDNILEMYISKVGWVHNNIRVEFNIRRSS